MIRFQLKPLFLACALTFAGGMKAFAVDWVHGSALTGEPRLEAGFKHFPYVNPDAPKGGTVRLAAVGSFDSFNGLIPKGEAAPGFSLVGAFTINESLMTSSLDELDISTQYGLLAEATRYPDDFSSVTFRMNTKAKWHDGMPVTVEDVIWSFEKTKELDARSAFYYENVVKAEKSADNEVTFTFNVKGNRELPHIMGQLQVFPKHWWEGKDDSGRQRNIAEPTLEPPLGSAAYKVGKFEAGRYVEFVRVADYWGKDHNTEIGTNNFDTMRIDLYGDESVMVEAFKGDAYDYRYERSSKNWATGYVGLPALDKGYVVKEEFPSRASGRMQAFILNLRKDKFKDLRVRRALNYAFDFETTNKNAFYGLYQRIPSYFAGTELASSGLPQGKELEILNEFKQDLPPEVFSQEYTNPVGGDAAKMRLNYREALALFKLAGWALKDGKLVNEKTGEPFTIELIDESPITERFALPYGESLKKIGVDFTYRQLDTSSMKERERKFDYDTITNVWGQSLSPGNEQREFWGSASADREGSRNYAGIKNPVIDKIIEKLILAKDRDDLIAATRALDRVLLWNHYVIPQWYSDVDRYVYWDRFGRPEKLPQYSFGFPAVWWFDPAKAARIAK
ncbi:MAG: extracellular solute-binding protein [Rhizobiaceae bacterium]